MADVTQAVAAFCKGGEWLGCRLLQRRCSRSSCSIRLPSKGGLGTVGAWDVAAEDGDRLWLVGGWSDGSGACAWGCSCYQAIGEGGVSQTVCGVCAWGSSCYQAIGGGVGLMGGGVEVRMRLQWQLSRSWGRESGVRLT